MLIIKIKCFSEAVETHNDPWFFFSVSYTTEHSGYSLPSGDPHLHCSPRQGKHQVTAWWTSLAPLFFYLPFPSIHFSLCSPPWLHTSPPSFSALQSCSCGQIQLLLYVDLVVHWELSHWLPVERSSYGSDATNKQTSTNHFVFCTVLLLLLLPLILLLLSPSGRCFATSCLLL